MDTLLDRFCRYVKVETTSVEGADSYPSSPGQLELGKMLTEELRALKLPDVTMDEHGIVATTIPATVDPLYGPTITWLAHTRREHSFNTSDNERYFSLTHCTTGASGIFFLSEKLSLIA